LILIKKNKLSIQSEFRQVLARQASARYVF